ncbi:MAG: hypothetical protein JRF33_26395 [Deltaproteobacteria bacterium]|nr:hypothetical protein [Deltaproteobacteria bacterium]
MDYRDLAEQLASGKLGPAGAAGKGLDAARRALELPEPDRSLSAFAEPMGIDYRGVENPQGEQRIRLTEPGWQPESGQRIRDAMSQSNLSDQDAGGVIDMLKERESGSMEGLDDWGEDFAGVAVDPGMMGDKNKMAAVSEIIRRLSSIPEGRENMPTENPSVKRRFAEPPTIIEKLKMDMQGPQVDDSMWKNPLTTNPQTPQRPRRQVAAAEYAPGKDRMVGG